MRVAMAPPVARNESKRGAVKGILATKEGKT
jgi:hypothetical protein